MCQGRSGPAANGEDFARVNVYEAIAAIILSSEEFTLWWAICRQRRSSQNEISFVPQDCCSAPRFFRTDEINFNG